MRKFPTGSKAEFKIENYLEGNAHLVEPELVLIKRQYSLYYIKKQLVGKIDLFCYGSDGADVCIELKAGALDARNVGQVMAYYDVLNKRAITHQRPRPRIYCIGASVSGHYKHALNILEGGETINLTTQIYRPSPGVKLEDDVWEIEIENYDPSFRLRMS